MTVTAAETPSDETLKPMLPVLIAGAVGGLLCWLLAVAFPDPAATFRPLIYLPLCLIGGAVAGGVGVFILANSDRRQLPRCLLFAALCGLAWKPVIDVGVGSVSNAVGVQADRKTVGEANDLAALSRSQVGDQLAQTADETVRLMAALPGIEDPKMRRTVRDGIKTAVATMEAAAAGDPAKAAEGLQALGKVGVAAAGSQGTSAIATLAADSVKAVATQPAADPGVVTAAYNSLGDVAAAAENAGSLGLAVQTREVGAQTVLTAARAASARNEAETIGEMPVQSACNDLRAAQGFYAATGDTGKARAARQQYESLCAVAAAGP